MALTVAEMLDHIRGLVDLHKTQSKLAASLGIKPPYLSDILTGRRGISEEIAKRLGFEKIELFVRKGAKK